MQLLDLFAGLLWLSSVIFLLFVLDVIITRFFIVNNRQRQRRWA